MNDRIVDRLKSYVYPFRHLSTAALDMAGKSLRVFHLYDGERIVFPSMGADDFLFLINGEIVVNGDERISVRYDAAGEPHRIPSDVGEISIHAANEAVLCRGNERMVEDFLALDELGSSGLFEESVNATEVLLSLRETETFRSLSIASAFQALQRMSLVDVANGDEVVTQYQEGDAYYIISEGKAEVWREELDDDEPQMVAVLGPGDGFGEESLVMHGARNATVKMISDGKVLKLIKDDFDELISTAMIESVKPEAAAALVKTGSKILDVRYQEEFEETSIPGSVLIPLPDLRARIHELDKAITYLVLCKKGSRAAAATLLLKQRGIRAMVIEGGIVGWDEAIS